MYNMEAAILWAFVSVYTPNVFSSPKPAPPRFQSTNCLLLRLSARPVYSSGGAINDEVLVWLFNVSNRVTSSI